MKQQLKQEYQETEIGKIPVDWDVIELEKLGDFKKGKGIKKTDVRAEGLPCIRYGEIYTKHHNYIKEINTFIPVEVSLKSQKIKKGDLLFAGSGETKEEIGKCVVYLKDIEAYAGGDIIILSPSKGDSLYLGFLMNHKQVVEQKSRYGQGDAVVHIYSSALKKVKIPFPDPAEQSAIAQVLSDTDNLIQELDKLIKKKKDIKKGAMQELLTGKKRLEGFKGDWEIKRLGDISDIRTGKKNNEDKVQEGNYPFFVRSQHVERINSYSFDGEAILVPGEGGIGTIFHYINDKFDYHQRVYKISNFYEGISGLFTYYYMLINFNQQAMKNSVKATVDSLRLPTFKEFEITYPSDPKEQVAIANVLSDMDSDIEELKQKKVKYEKIKEGMMQQLLTGRIRLKWKN